MGRIWGAMCVKNTYKCYTCTRPKLRFPTCPVFQNMTFTQTSYTYLTKDRATFHANIYKSDPDNQADS